MKTPLVLTLALAVMAGATFGSESLTITVSHDLEIARPSEMISIPWTDVNTALPGALIQRIAVKDASGRVLAHQVTNVAPQAKDPEGKGVAYGELLFQYDFAAGEKSATFTVERIDTVAPVFTTKTFARHVPERLDDFAWENDKIAHRTYGPALGAPALPGSGKEVLVTSGLDVWSKRVSYPIVNRWYNKGHDHYHTDQGEGMDLYQVGPSRGCGGTGIWDGQRLHVGRNFQTWRILANGPIRTQFELSYDTWMADGVIVSEVKRVTLDAGHQLNKIESTFTVAGRAREIVVGIGLHKNPSDRGQDPVTTVNSVAEAGTLTQWIVQKTNGDLGTAVIVPGGQFNGFAADERNLLVLAKVNSGEPVRYYAGAGWSRAGEFTSQKAWENYVAAWATRAGAPIKISLSTAP